MKLPNQQIGRKENKTDKLAAVTLLAQPNANQRVSGPHTESISMGKQAVDGATSAKPKLIS